MPTLRPWPAGDTQIVSGVVVDDASRLMRWRDQYLLCDSCVLSGGRRLDLLETNYADGYRPHDLGASGQRIEATVVFVGDSWRQHCQNFLAVIQAGGVYDLYLPNAGPVISAAVENWSWDDQHGPREGATFSVTWVSAGVGSGALVVTPQAAASMLPAGATSTDAVDAYDEAVGAPDASSGAVDAALAEALVATATDQARLNLNTVQGIADDEALVLARASMLDAYPWPDNPPSSWYPLES